MSDIKVICDRDELVNIANSVRRKNNISKEMSLDEIAEEINNISGGGGGEDVTAETTEYTTKLASLETAITALETELAGKASGGSGGGICPSLTITGDSTIQILTVNLIRNGQYVRIFSPQKLPVVIENIDVGETICAAFTSKWGIYITSEENAKVFNPVNEDDYMFIKCTSTSPATITCREDD